MKKDWMIKESELDDDQVKVLMATLDKSCIVAGCAGSGKSVLALIKAQRVQKEFGTNYKIIVYTKALCRYMNSGKQELGLRNDFYYHWDWKNRQGMPGADYIIVDEIQDFTKAEIMEFVRAAKKNFFFFGDTAQSIYDSLKSAEGGTLPVDVIRWNLPSSAQMNVKNFELYRNYRLPIPVAKLAQEIGVDTSYVEGTYKSTEKDMPRIIYYPDYIDQVKAIHRIIKNRNLTDVAILLPYNKDVKLLYDEITKLGGNYEMKFDDRDNYRNSQDTLNFNSTNPKIMTYHSAKGLQFEAVFLPWLEDYDEEHGLSDRKALYVAMTRTYRYLYVMYSGGKPAVISRESLRPLYKNTETDTINDL